MDSTSTSGPLTGAAAGRSLFTASSAPAPLTLALEEYVRSFDDAPTEMADGEVAGDDSVLKPGPSLPAAATTITPNSLSCAACGEADSDWGQ